MSMHEVPAVVKPLQGLTGPRPTEHEGEAGRRLPEVLPVLFTLVLAAGAAADSHGG